MSFDAFAGLVAGISPGGTFWSGPAADRYRLAIVESMRELVEFLCSLPDQMAPFKTQHGAVLEQWRAFLSRSDCVPPPTALEELRALVLALLGANSASFTTGLQESILAYLPLVLVHDDRPISHVPLEIPSPVDSGAATITVWFSALEDNAPLTISCVARALSPAVSSIRLVTPVLAFDNPTNGSLAGDLTLFWAEMLTAQIDLKLFNVGLVQVDSVLASISPDDDAVVSDLLPLTNAGDNVSGFRLDVAVASTWAGDTRKIFDDSYTWP